MAKMAVPLPIALAAPASAAEPLTAEAALGYYRETLLSSAGLDCSRVRDSDEVVVCGRSRRPDPNRPPLPVEPPPGETIRGEPISAVAAAGTRETCSTVGPNQNCGGGLPIMAMVAMAAKVLVKAVTSR